MPISPVPQSRRVQQRSGFPIASNIWANGISEESYCPVLAGDSFIGICPFNQFQKASRGSCVLSMEVTVKTGAIPDSSVMTHMSIATDRIVSTWGGWESPILFLDCSFLPDRQYKVKFLEDIIKRLPIWPEHTMRFAVNLGGFQL